MTDQLDVIKRTLKNVTEFRERVIKLMQLRLTEKHVDKDSII